MTTYCVRNWDKHFETYDTKRIKNNLKYVLIPNSHDSLSFRRLVKREDKIEIFCAWGLILQIASKMPVRGILLDNGHPLTPDDIETMTGFPARIFELAFKELSKPELGWIETISQKLEREKKDIRNGSNLNGANSAEMSHELGADATPKKLIQEKVNHQQSTEICSRPAADLLQVKADCRLTEGANSTVQNNTEQNKHVRNGEKAKLDVRFSRFWERYPKKEGKGTAEKAFQKLKPDDNLLDQMLSAIELHKVVKKWDLTENYQWIPQPSTWLNGRRWEDDYSESVTIKDPRFVAEKGGF